MRYINAALAIACIAGLTQSLHAQNPAICPGLTGQARNDCLKAEFAKKQAAADAANKRLQQLDRAMSIACTTVQTLDKAAEAASLVGTISGAKPFSFGGLTWTSARSLATDRDRERKNCEDAKQAIAAAKSK